MSPGANASLGAFLLPGDSIGSTTITFQGVHSGSEIRIYQPDGTEVGGVESCATDQSIAAVPYYVGGSGNNTVTIRIVAMAYRILEFTYTLSAVSAQSIPIQQYADSWYSNP